MNKAERKARLQQDVDVLMEGLGHLFPEAEAADLLTKVGRILRFQTQLDDIDFSTTATSTKQGFASSFYEEYSDSDVPQLVKKLEHCAKACAQLAEDLGLACSFRREIEVSGTAYSKVAGSTIDEQCEDLAANLLLNVKSTRRRISGEYRFHHKESK